MTRQQRLEAAPRWHIDTANVVDGAVAMVSGESGYAR